MREPAERSEFLITACDVDERLRLEVETLIAAEMLGTHKSRVTPGEQIDNFGIVRQLGVGGMGEVYLANDTRLNRKAALKLLENGGHLQKFKRCS